MARPTLWQTRLMPIDRSIELLEFRDAIEEFKNSLYSLYRVSKAEHAEITPMRLEISPKVSVRKPRKARDPNVTTIQVSRDFKQKLKDMRAGTESAEKTLMRLLGWENGVKYVPLIRAGDAGLALCIQKPTMERSTPKGSSAN
jgi:hypothetical protein